MGLLEHLRRIYSFEEDLVPKINDVLNLLLVQTDLKGPEADEIKGTLKELTEETLQHKSVLEKIIRELESNDK
jgi:hypothetical protein